MAHNRRIALLVVALGLPLGCARIAAPVQCEKTGTNASLQVMLFFGRAIPGRGDLSEAEWGEFLHDAVTPSLPDGFTAWDANGQWQSANGRVFREATKVVLASIPDSPERLNAIAHIRRAYAARFHQQSVGMTLTRVCAAF